MVQTPQWNQTEATQSHQKQHEACSGRANRPCATIATGCYDNEQSNSDSWAPWCGVVQHAVLWTWDCGYWGYVQGGAHCPMFQEPGLHTGASLLWSSTWETLPWHHPKQPGGASAVLCECHQPEESQEEDHHALPCRKPTLPKQHLQCSLLMAAVGGITYPLAKRNTKGVDALLLQDTGKFFWNIFIFPELLISPKSRKMPNHTNTWGC